ncbi:MAG: hypothetical protein ACP5MJ_06490 [Roseiflexus sp.]
MGKRRRAIKPGTRRAAAQAPSVGRGVLLLVAGMMTLLAVAGAGWWMMRSAENALPAAPARPSSVIGGVTGCRGIPRFVARLGYADRLGISTSERTHKGLVIFDGRVPVSADPAQRDIHQEPSWDDAGTLGPFVIDRDGHIYTAAVPRTAVSDNPPGSLNVVYRIDSETAELQPFVTLPGAVGSSENPFGILGMAYDCDTHALYVSTVAGSTRQAEQGRIVRIDLASKEISDEVIGVDAIGLAVFQGRAGKRLYIGLARSADVGSVALDTAGHATGEFRVDLALDERLAQFAAPRVRRISFDQTNMTLFVVPFAFNLRAVSEQQQVTLRYGYDAERDSWVPFPASIPASGRVNLRG